MDRSSPRLHLRCALRPIRASAAASPGLRRMARADTAALARLLHAAYLGTVDYEGETEEDAAAVVEATLDGEYGAFVEDASWVIERDGRLVSAAFVTMGQGEPLLAFAVTAPQWKGQGLARTCTAAAMQALAGAGHRELHLFVNPKNEPALAVYSRLGFRRNRAA